MRNPSDVGYLTELAESGYGELDDFYPKTAAGALEPSAPYYGRNIIWDGIDGRMIRVYPHNVRAIAGNIFDADKLAAIVSGVDQAEERLVFTAPYGDVGVIDLDLVKESLEYADEEEPYTTGDEELDRYLAEGDEYIADELYLDPEDDAEEWAEEKARLEEELAAAVANDEGDLGDFWVQIRDGNHRTFGAFASGEPYIYMIVTRNRIQDLMDYPHERGNAQVREALE